jgi:predicted nucleic acid-binding protein
VRGAVFLDSGIFVAFLNRRDQWHEQAVSLFDGPAPSWHSSLLVVAEAYSWFLHRLGEEAARDFLRFMDDLPGLTLHPARAELHQATRKMLQRFRGSKLTYADASSLAILEGRKIRRVWSTDHHLGLTGAEVLPRR